MSSPLLRFAGHRARRPAHIPATLSRLALSASFVGLAAAATPALAQDAGTASDAATQPAPVPAPTPAPSAHPENGGQEIVVTGRLISGHADPVSAPVVLSGDTLTRAMKPQIGDMLASLPGVSSSGFAPGVSRPVLRGFDGPRVQVLVDGIGSLDASSVSADHAVSLDTLNVDRIDVIHGPQVLLYAGDPSGGAVIAQDTRIPRKVPDRFATVKALASYGTAAKSVNGGAAIDVRLAPRLVAHFDASYNHADDEHIGGYVLSPQLRAATLAQADDLRSVGDIAGADTLVAQADRSGTLPNSWSKGWTLGSGLAFIDDGGDIGVSVQRLATDYGIPPRPSTTPDNTSISLRQTRFDLRSGVNLDGFFKRLEFRGAYGRYEHAELDDGTVGTQFRNQAVAARFTAEQARHGGWTGTTGISYDWSRLDISGEELLLPNNTTSRFAAFTLQRVELGKLDLEGAARIEKVAVDALDGGPRRDFTPRSGGVGLAWHALPGLTASVSFAHGERAPAAEELFVDGAHDATQSYERGNPDFTIERSNGIEAGLRYASDDFAGSLTLFGTDFANFITSVPTGAMIEGVPVFQYIQAPARFRGIEAEGAVTLARPGDGTVRLDGGVDYTRARLVGLGPVPRIPPLRARGGLEYKSPALDLRGEVVWNARQGRVTTYEYPTDAYTLVNLSASWRPMGEDSPVTLILAADNLLDVTGRLAASETRDFVPITGRDVRLTASFSL